MNGRLKLALVAGCAFISALAAPRAGLLLAEGLRGPYGESSAASLRVGSVDGERATAEVARTPTLAGGELALELDSFGPALAKAPK